MYTHKSIKIELELTPNEAAAMKSALFMCTLNEKEGTWEGDVLSRISSKYDYAVSIALIDGADNWSKAYIPISNVCDAWRNRYVKYDCENLRWRFTRKEVA